MRSKITPHFTFREMTKTDTGLPNKPDKYQQIHLVHLCRSLERVRDKLNRGNLGDPIPIIINSAFRSKAVNDKLRELGYDASPSSYHLDGRAADISTAHLSDSQIDVLINALYDEFPSEIITHSTYIHFAI